MPLNEMVLIEPVNGKQPGAIIKVGDVERDQLIGRGLAKMRGQPNNKMQKDPVNKSNPTPAAGRDKQSPASPAARASRQTTARPSTSGAGNRGNKEE